MQLDIFSPVRTPPTCTLDWEHITPGQKQWFCEHCQHHVHNLSSMTRREAKSFMAASSDTRRCLSFMQDDEGRAIFQPDKSPPHFVRSAAAFITSAALTMLEVGCSKAVAQD